MEGVTDDIYRYSVEKAFGGWDYYACDFLRIPAAGKYPSKHIIKHYGKRSFETDFLREKTYYQILASEKSFIENTVALIQEIGFDWLDINLGCPSKTVCKNKGGSFLLSDLKLLETVVTRVRKNFKGHFTAKIRLGYKDDQNFLDILKCLEDCGVEAITIHGRTQDQLYKGRAVWGPIKKAVQHVDIPIVGNGDIWNINDIKQIFNETGCHGAMLARGAMKAPWLASDYKKSIINTEQDTKDKIQKFLSTFLKELIDHQVENNGILKRLKSLSRYMYEDLTNGDQLRAQLLRSQDINAYLKNWEAYSHQANLTSLLPTS